MSPYRPVECLLVPRTSSLTIPIRYRSPQTPKITQILSNPFAQLIKNILNMFYNKNVSIGRNVRSLKTRVDQIHQLIVKPARSFTMDATRSVLFGEHLCPWL